MERGTMESANGSAGWPTSIQHAG